MHYCGHSRAGKFKLKRKTAKKKFRVKVRALKAWFRENLTTPTAEVWAKLNSKLRGHYQYYGVNDNWPWVLKYRRVAVQLGLRWLRRRSQAATMSRAAYRIYLTRHEIANPKKIVDLIAMAR